MAVGGAIGAGPTAAFIPELFATRYRYSGSALALNLAGVVGGALPPPLAGTLLATYVSWSIGVMLAALTLASVVSNCRGALVSRKFDQKRRRRPKKSSEPAVLESWR